MRRTALLTALLTVLVAAAWPLRAARNLPLDKIGLPPGFHIALYAEQVPNAREMTLAPDGTVFVGTRQGSVYALVDPRHENRAEVVVIARGLTEPNGVAFRNGALFVAEVDRVWRYDDILAKLRKPGAPKLVSSAFPSDRWHGWKFIAFGPDGWLYVPIGFPCNVCERSDGRYGTIMRMRPDGSGLSVYASGVRNTVGFDWDPQSHDLWFTDNGRDNLGDEVPPDELNHAPRKGMNFGFPYCHGKNVSDPEFGARHPCSQFAPPALELPAHVASLGMRFYTGPMFPADYRGRIFIAEHGSWNRSRKVGYQVVSVRMRNGAAVDASPFASGWLQGESAWGRPVDVLVMPDGALLVSDDQAGAVYRIRYEK
ncbi:MAG: PQQ-dependent sugar dehydrogenase [Thermoanaerobaculia bacterium]